ncbi:MAG TPA: hypothetical protein VFH54_10420 [Mycobacteriales bacterium]|nr:hypothetical protein [Mycobacteriales bacterium]
MKTLGAQGVLSVYWSPRVRQLVEELRTQIDAAFSAWISNCLARSGGPSGYADYLVDAVDLLNAFTTAKGQIDAIDLTIRNQVQAEITGKHDGHAEATSPARDQPVKPVQPPT